jgi:hypothetical protein
MREWLKSRPIGELPPGNGSTESQSFLKGVASTRSINLEKNSRLNRIVQELGNVFGRDAYDITMTQKKQRYLICRRDSMRLDLWEYFMPPDCKWYRDCRPHNKIASFRLDQGNGCLQKRELADNWLHSDDADTQCWGLLSFLSCGFKSYEGFHWEESLLQPNQLPSIHPESIGNSLTGHAVIVMWMPF